MNIQDLIITPAYIFLISLIAYVVRPYVTNARTKAFFLPALGFKFFGAIVLGVIYQFYYNGGDTFGYFDFGSRWVWEAILKDPLVGVQMLFEYGEEAHAETYVYTRNILYFGDGSSYAIVKIAGVFDLFTFHTYSATALFFAVFNFSGSWALFQTINKKYPYRVYSQVFAIFFIPSVIFWGSGILKDTITFGALAWMTSAAFQLIEQKRSIVLNALILLTAGYLIYVIKLYILLSFLPMTIFWIYWRQITAIRNTTLKWIAAPIMLLLFSGVGYFATSSVSAGSERYRLENIAQTAAVTAYDIRYGWGARAGGDGGYDLGELDGSWGSMIRLFPKAVVVSLYRPFLWEVRNPLMLLSAMEALLALIFTLRWIRNGGWRRISSYPFLVFCLGFTLIFAFAVGVSTFNFGTLARYKIPMLPFLAMVVLEVCEPIRKVVRRDQ